MSRKHFEALAEVVRNLRQEAARHDSDWICIDAVASALAKMAYQFNPRFDRMRFLRACKLPGLPAEK
jgi:hypothetical protein